MRKLSIRSQCLLALKKYPQAASQLKPLLDKILPWIE